jgi:hypothetical protein
MDMRVISDQLQSVLKKQTKIQTSFEFTLFHFNFKLNRFIVGLCHFKGIPIDFGNFLIFFKLVISTEAVEDDDDETCSFDEMITDGRECLLARGRHSGMSSNLVHSRLIAWAKREKKMMRC